MSQPLTTTITSTTTSKPPLQPLCTFLFFIILCILGFYTLHHPHFAIFSRNPQTALRFRRLFLSSASNDTLSSYLRALTEYPHLAGTNASLNTVRYVENHFRSSGLETYTASNEALLSYPIHASLTVHFNNGTSLSLSLIEQGILDFGNSGLVQPYHAYSPSGSVRAKVVFVNFGREEDYRALGAVGVNVSGCIVLVRKCETLGRGGVVEIAEGKGALGVLLYSDNGGARGGDFGGVERGTVMRGIGDPLTPGWPGVKGGERLGFEDADVLRRFPKIPSMPLSLANAEIILASLRGAMVLQEWSDSGGAKPRGVGPGPTIVNLTYQGEKKLATIHNVFAVIKGFEEPDRYVLLGNHRDAWTYGAVDPNSGTAGLLDIARRYALLMRNGWKPRRTIILCSWDAEEFGMIGSTEWVEQNIVNLGAKAVAYLNVDCAVQGPGFFAGATPQLDTLIADVTKEIQDPDLHGATVYETWKEANKGINIQRLSGVDSDFAPFLQHAGVPAIDIYYGKDFPVYHTAFDSFEWMMKFGDPLFKRHVAVVGIWGVMALHLADDSILPFNYVSYADQLQQHTDALNKILEGGVALDALTTSIQQLLFAAKEAQDEEEKLKDQETADAFIALKMRALNDRLMLAERGFVDTDGVKGREWFKHLIYGPPGEHESKLTFFPGIADAISMSSRMSQKDADAAIRHEIWRVARAIQRSAVALKGDLT